MHTKQKHVYQKYNKNHHNEPACGSSGNKNSLYPIIGHFTNVLYYMGGLVAIGAIILIIPLLAIPLRGNSSTSKFAAVEFEQTVGAALREAVNRDPERFDRVSILKETHDPVFQTARTVIRAFKPL